MIDNGIITNVPEENIQQHGIDLNVTKIRRILGGGVVGAKTILPEYQEIEFEKGLYSTLEKLFVEIAHGEEDHRQWLAKKVSDFYDQQPRVWKLSPGTYDVTFSQGCNIPADQMLLIRQRSSVLRNGAILHSSVFDAGFKTDNIGTVMIVTVPLTIEHGARIAQIYNHLTTPVQNLYNGQWQGDKQRLV